MKKLFILLTVLVVLFSLVSCSGKQEGVSTTATEPEAEIVTVVSTLTDGETVIETVVETVALPDNTTPTGGSGSVNVSETEVAYLEEEPATITPSAKPVPQTAAPAPETTKANTAATTAAGDGVSLVTGDVDEGWF